MSEKIYRGAVGVAIVLDTMIDVSQVADPKIHYQKPNSRGIGVWPAVAVETTKLRYLTEAPDDLDVAGTWKFQSGYGSTRGRTFSYRIYAEFA